jgi:hypothetical protein
MLSLADIFQDEMARYPRALLGGNPASCRRPCFWAIYTAKTRFPAPRKGGAAKT